MEIGLVPPKFASADIVKSVMTNVASRRLRFGNGANQVRIMARRRGLQRNPLTTTLTTSDRSLPSSHLRQDKDPGYRSSHSSLCKQRNNDKFENVVRAVQGSMKARPLKEHRCSYRFDVLPMEIATSVNKGAGVKNALAASAPRRIPGQTR